jgi:hypothetical protein
MAPIRVWGNVLFRIPVELGSDCLLENNSIRRPATGVITPYLSSSRGSCRAGKDKANLQVYKGRIKGGPAKLQAAASASRARSGGTIVGDLRWATKSTSGNWNACMAGLYAMSNTPRGSTSPKALLR